jgi:uridine kinase
MDNYFKERVETPKHENGEYDYECLEAIDLNLFNKQIEALLNNEKIIIPTYNFITGSKEYKNELHLEENDILIIEGIHGLNNKILRNIPEEEKYKIYLSALAELNIDYHNRVSTSDNRLLRRIVRDNRTRGYTVNDTLSRWRSVRLGEEKYIFPHQDNANVVVDTALIYEIGVIKTYVLPLLYSVDISSPYYDEAKRLIDYLSTFLPIPSESIPVDSILREFIGGSCFE